MPIKTPREIMEDCCAATVGIRKRHGVESALRYLVGEKLVDFTTIGETHPEFFEQLPEFSRRIRELFTTSEIESYFSQAERESLVDPDIMKSASEEELEELHETLKDEQRARERRNWVKAMLLRQGA